MRKILILTDSTADLNKEQYEKLNIKVIPLLVNFDGETYQDGIDIDSSLIYEKVANGADLPKTSSVSPAAFIEIFQEYINKDYDIFYVGIGSLLSGTFLSATIAKSDFPLERIALVDSMNLSSATGLLVVKACKLRDEGKNIHEIAAEIKKLVPYVSSQFSVQTMDYLYKGGRCSGIKYFLGKLLSIHPVIKVTNGRLDVFDTPKGKFSRSLDIQFEILDKDLPNIDMDHIFITHSSADQRYLDYVYGELSKRLPKEMITITQTGSVISSHCGPNTIGLLWISGQKVEAEELKGKQPKKEKRIK